MSGQHTSSAAHPLTSLFCVVWIGWHHYFRCISLQSCLIVPVHLFFFIPCLLFPHTRPYNGIFVYWFCQRGQYFSHLCGIRLCLSVSSSYVESLCFWLYVFFLTHIQFARTSHFKNFQQPVPGCCFNRHRLLRHRQQTIIARIHLITQVSENLESRLQKLLSSELLNLDLKLFFIVAYTPVRHLARSSAPPSHFVINGAIQNVLRLD